MTMRDSSGDHNLYLYNSPVPGDWTLFDAAARNPVPYLFERERDLWQIPGGNDAAAMCGLDTTGDGNSDSLLVVWNEGGDYNVYQWNMPVPGDMTYPDAIARDPSPLARDLWLIPSGNDTTDMAAPK